MEPELYIMWLRYLKTYIYQIAINFKEVADEELKDIQRIDEDDENDEEDEKKSSPIY